MKLTTFSLEPIDIRLSRAVRTAAGSVGDRSGLVLRLESADGHHGVGEAAPIPGRPSPGLDNMAAELLEWAEGSRGADTETLIAEIDRVDRSAMVRFAVHTALVDLTSRSAGVPFGQFLRIGAATDVRVNALVADESPAAVSESCASIRRQGFSAVKLKVAAAPTAVDVTRIIAASEALGPRIELRLDANHGWSAEQFTHVIGRVGPRRLGYVEDPTPDALEYGLLSESTGVAIALDVTVSEPDAVERTIASSGAAVAVVKAAALGGVDRVLEVARRLGGDRRVVVSSSLDGTIGLSAGLHAAAALPDADVHGLATAEMVRGIPDSLRPETGSISLASRPGLGID